MNNNQDEMNRLINELAIQKNKDRKHLLRIEIAKATDRTVKKALQDILDDIERKERRNMILGIIAFIIIGLVGFYFLGTKNENKENYNVTSVTSNSSEKTNESTVSEKKENVIKEKTLPEEEVKQWVSAVWEKRHQNVKQVYEYKLDVRVDNKDNLVYIDLLPQNVNEIDPIGRFRINAKGELEELPSYVEADSRDWIVVSNKFMDTSSVPIISNRNQKKMVDTKDLDSEEAIKWVKNYRLQEEGISDEGDNKFKTQLSDDRLLEVIVYAWNQAKTAQTISSVYRINEDGYLEQGSPNTFSNWHVVSTEYIY